MKFSRRHVLSALAAAPVLDKLAAFDEVTIFTARKIVTMEAGYPQARAMAVSRGMVLGLAQSVEALSPWLSGRKAAIDDSFADKVLFPGLIDPHIHPMQAAVMLSLPFLAPDEWHLPSGHYRAIRGARDYRAALGRLVAERAERADPDEPLIVWGHHELFHGALNRAILDEIAPERPLLVWQRSFHDIYANSAALRWMKLGTRAAFDAAIKSVGADAAHNSFERGVFSETGLNLALARLRPVLLAPAKLAHGFDDLKAMMRARGVTTTSDLATGIFADFDQEAALIAAAFNAPDAHARVNLMPIAARLDAMDDPRQWLDEARARFAHGHVALRQRVKLFADGAFFAQNMRIGPPGYTDGHQGKWLTAPDQLTTQVERYWKAGFSLHIHVNGDEGVEAVLTALDRIAPAHGQDIVLEHLGYCTEAQLRRIARIGAMVSAQPNYIRVLGEAYARQGLGPDRAALMNRLGTLERAGVTLGLHSDFNMAPIDPFYLAWIAQTRMGLDGVARAPAERLSRAKALRAITIEAARVIGADRAVGSLAAGKRADFIALDNDPFDVEVDQMREMPIRAVAFEGRVAKP